MKKADLIDLTELLSYKPGREQILMILKEVKETGKTIAEVADAYAMPPLFILDDDGTFVYKDEKMTKEQFRQKFPHRRIVLITTREQKEKFDKLDK